MLSAFAFAVLFAFLGFNISRGDVGAMFFMGFFGAVVGFVLSRIKLRYGKKG